MEEEVEGGSAGTNITRALDLVEDRKASSTEQRKPNRGRV